MQSAKVPLQSFLMINAISTPNEYLHFQQKLPLLASIILQFFTVLQSLRVPLLLAKQLIPLLISEFLQVHRRSVLARIYARTLNTIVSNHACCCLIHSSCLQLPVRMSRIL